MMCLKILALFLIFAIASDQVNAAVVRKKRLADEEKKDQIEEKISEGSKTQIEKAGEDKEKASEDKEKTADVKGKAGDEQEKYSSKEAVETSDNKKVQEKSSENASIDKSTVTKSAENAETKIPVEKSAKDAATHKPPVEKSAENAVTHTPSVGKSAEDAVTHTPPVEKSAENAVADKSAEKSAEVTGDQKDKKIFASRTLNAKGNKSKENENKKNDKKNDDKKLQDKTKKESSGLKNIVVIPEKETSIINLTVYNRAPDESFLKALRNEKSGSENNKDIPDVENDFKKRLPSLRTQAAASEEEPDYFNINSDTPCILNSHNQIECALDSVSRGANDKPSDDNNNVSFKKLLNNLDYWDARNGARLKYNTASDGFDPYKNFASDGSGLYSDYTGNVQSSSYNPADKNDFVPFSSLGNVDGSDPYANYDNYDNVRRVKLLGIWYLNK